MMWQDILKKDMSYCVCSGKNKTKGFTCKAHCRSKELKKFFRKPKKATINAQKIIINGKEVPKEIAELAIGEARGAVTINAGGNHYDSIDQAILDKYMKDYDRALQKAPRIPRKKGQPANSKKHSDLYTDENPKGTIQGLGFKDVETAKRSVAKIKRSNRSHAHKTQAAIAMEQRAREMGKLREAQIYRAFINAQKKKTKAKKKLKRSRGRGFTR